MFFLRPLFQNLTHYLCALYAFSVAVSIQHSRFLGGAFKADFCSLFAHLGGFRVLLLVAQDAPVHIRAQVFAANLAICQFLDGNATFGGDSAKSPLISYSVSVKPKVTRKSDDPSAHLYCPVKGVCTRSCVFHAYIVDSLAILAKIFYL